MQKTVTSASQPFAEQVSDLSISPAVEATASSRRDDEDDELPAWPPPRPRRKTREPAHLQNFVRAIFIARDDNLGNSFPVGNVTKSAPVTAITDDVTDIVTKLSVCSLSREYMEDGWICEFCARQYKSERALRRHYIQKHRHYFVKYCPSMLHYR